jgi:hypothetical protein
MARLIRMDTTGHSTLAGLHARPALDAGIRLARLSSPAM